MKNFSQFKQQIRALEDIEETVQAEEKIAAANIHWLFKENKIFSDYLDSFRDIFYRLILYFDSLPPSLFFKKTNNRKKLLLILGGEKGLTGGLWQKLLEEFKKFSSDYEQIIIVGSKLALRFKEGGFESQKVLRGFSNLPSEEETERVFLEILNFLKEEKVGQIDILYPRLKDINTIEPRVFVFLPLQSAFQREEQSVFNLGWPVFEPKKEKILSKMVEEYVRLRFFQICWESKLSELLSRAIAMEKASEQVKQMRKKLVYKFFRERRKILTKNQIEVFVAHKVSKKQI